MDLSGLIFVALAVAWAVYLIPKALTHHDDASRSRSIDTFSQGLRVLARREAVNRRDARLVVTRARAAGAAVVTTQAPVPPPSVDELVAARRGVTRRATRRRRRVLALLLLLGAGVAAAAAAGLIAWWYVAAPAGLLVAWLVACRLMVRGERAWSPAAVVGPELPDEIDLALEEAPEGDLELTSDHPVVAHAPGATSRMVAESPASAPGPVAPPVAAAPGEREPGLWDPVPVTLPTYVSKPAARRTVRTIDLDATGVWSSGHATADSKLAREAEEADKVDKAARAEDDARRAAGS